MKLIGINGFKRSGKDTIYQIIKDQTDDSRVVQGDTNVEQDATKRVERRAFADNLKIMAALALGWDERFNPKSDLTLDEYLIYAMNSIKDEGSVESYLLPTGATSYEVHTITGREYLQKFGAHAREVFGDSFWVDQVVPLGSADFHDVWSTLGRKGNYAGLPAIGCVTDVRYANEADRIKQSCGTVLEVVRPGLESDGHSSEQPLDLSLVDYTILNDGGLDDLTAKVKRFLNEVGA